MTEPEHRDEPLDPADAHGPVGGGFTGGIRDLLTPTDDEKDESRGEDR